jgi:lipoprotein-anchoring transpeptidase ErfK/SrfK
MWRQVNAGSGDAPDGRDPEERRRGLRVFLIVSLIACVMLLGIGGVIAGVGLGGLALGASGASQRPTQSRTTPPDASKITTNQPQDPDIVPACDCQTSQTTAKINLDLSGVGKEILVDIDKQQLFAYQDGQLQFTYLVATGRPGLDTPVGRWHVMEKRSDFTFYSPWPVGDPNYYYPTHIHNALLFREGGFYLHDSWWRCLYGPGANVWHHATCMDEGDPPNRGPKQVDGGETGSHGCVGMTMPNAKMLYDWAPIGTTVIVYKR